MIHPRCSGQVLAQTARHLLFYEYEQTCLWDKQAEAPLFQVALYGGPSCGVLDPENRWALVGGAQLYLWERTAGLRVLEGICWVHDMRLQGPGIVELLTDPWRPDAAIWTLRLQDRTLRRIKKFDAFQGTPYTDNVIW